MKIQCDVCEKAEARVFCAADEAALCVKCDEGVHHANKLAVKHLRYSLFNSSCPPNSSTWDVADAIAAPLCDICQERRAFMFCREDRAILCRECDLPIHSATKHTQKHTRFLLTGIKLSDYTPTPTHFDTQPPSSVSSSTNNNNNHFSSSSPSEVTQTYIAQSNLTTTSSSSPTLTPHPNDYYYTSDKLFGDGSILTNDYRYSNVDNDTNTVKTADYYATTTSSCEMVPSSSIHSGGAAASGSTGGGWHVDHHSTFLDDQYYYYSHSHAYDPAAHQFFTTYG